MSKQDFRQQLEEILDDHAALYASSSAKFISGAISDYERDEQWRFQDFYTIDAILHALDELIGPDEEEIEASSDHRDLYPSVRNAERQRIRQALGLETTNTGGQGDESV